MTAEEAQEKCRQSFGVASVFYGTVDGQIVITCADDDIVDEANRIAVCLGSYDLSFDSYGVAHFSADDGTAVSVGPWRMVG